MFARLFSALVAVVLIGGCVIRDETGPAPRDREVDVKVRVPAVNVDIKKD